MSEISITTAYDITTSFEIILGKILNNEITMREALDRLAAIRTSAEEVGLEFDLNDAEKRLRTRAAAEKD